MLFEDLTGKVIAACMEVHRHMGNGFLEAVYADALEQEFKLRNIGYQREKEFRIRYKGVELSKSYRVDFCCFDVIIVEIKAIDDIHPVHVSQLINYLKMSDYPVGLLINFGSTSLQSKRRDNLSSSMIPKSLK